VVTTATASVLVVDDDPRMLSMMRRVLESRRLRRHGGADGHALDVLRSRAIDLLILDVMMPDLDGFGCVASCAVRAPFDPDAHGARRGDR
jgi:CheY-like chemotaxis protein